jgi:hypothetical protein
MTPLAKVSTAAARNATARAKLIAAVRDARDSGEPLRTIAVAAGVTHQTIRLWLEKGTR